MAIRNYVIRVSGNIALENNEVRSFSEVYDSAELFSLDDGNLAYRSMFPSKKTIHDALAIWNNTITDANLTRTADPTDSPIAVTSVSMVVTGTVAYIDDTVKTFAFEIRDDDQVYEFNDEESEAAWQDLITTSTAAKDLILGIFETLLSTIADPIGVEIGLSSMSTGSSRSSRSSSSSTVVISRSSLSTSSSSSKSISTNSTGTTNSSSSSSESSNTTATTASTNTSSSSTEIISRSTLSTMSNSTSSSKSLSTSSTVILSRSSESSSSSSTPG